MLMLGLWEFGWRKLRNTTTEKVFKGRKNGIFMGGCDTRT